MDPDQALKNARRAVAEMSSLAEGSVKHINAAEDLRTAFEALDDWLTKGGFLPGPWSNGSQVEALLAENDWLKLQHDRMAGRLSMGFTAASAELAFAISTERMPTDLPRFRGAR